MDKRLEAIEKAERDLVSMQELLDLLRTMPDGLPADNIILTSHGLTLYIPANMSTYRALRNALGPDYETVSGFPPMTGDQPYGSAIVRHAPSNALIDIHMNATRPGSRCQRVLTGEKNSAGLRDPLRRGIRRTPMLQDIGLDADLDAIQTVGTQPDPGAMLDAQIETLIEHPELLDSDGALHTPAPVAPPEDDRPLTVADIREVFGSYVEFRIQAIETAATERKARKDLEKARFALLAEPERITGKNEAAREAQLRQLLATQYEALEQAEDAAHEAHDEAELAYLDIDAIKTELRLLELLPATPVTDALANTITQDLIATYLRGKGI